MKNTILSAIGIFMLSLCVTTEPSAYEGGAVTNGGTIVGVVNFRGSPPHPKKLQVSKDKEVCGKSAKSDPSLMVANGEVEDAVVYIADIEKGKKMIATVVKLDQRDCEYHPHVLAFPAGSTLEVLNPDGILHNIHSYSKKNTPFNFAQPKFKKTLTINIDKSELINVKCDVHNWMTGWLFSAANPYYAVTDRNGGFTLTDVPPGTYTLKVWHETLGSVSQKVTVKPNKEVKVNFELTKK